MAIGSRRTATAAAAAMAVSGCLGTPDERPDAEVGVADSDAATASCTPPVGGPGVRNGHGMAWDARRDRLVLFGGADDCQVLGDTWIWQEGAWQRLDGSGPPPRTFPAMAFDADRGEVVLFGGNRVLFGDDDHPPSTLSDTWVLGDGGWERRAADPTPGARAEPATAFDAARGRVVLFGGYRAEGDSLRRLGDTWEWDGEGWREVDVSGPSARNGAAMAYDPVRERIVLFGGRGGTTETWLYDGLAWIPFDGPIPSGAFDPELAWHAGRNGLVRFGGYADGERLDETWLWRDGWTRLPLDGPSARNHARLVGDAEGERVLLYGGHDGPRVFGDLWVLGSDGPWRLIHDAAPRDRIENGH